MDVQAISRKGSKQRKIVDQTAMREGSRDWSSISTMDDPDGVWANVANCLEKLRSVSSTHQQKEALLKKLSDLVCMQEEAKTAAWSHSQAIPILVSVLRSGTLTAKTHAATIIGALCTKGESRIKVLLGGSIPPLVSLLRSNVEDAQIMAAKTLSVLSQVSNVDNVGPKIFSTEGLIPSLWENLRSESKSKMLVDGFLTNTLKNICESTDSFWEASLTIGALDILLQLLRNGSSDAISNACYLLSKAMIFDRSICIRCIESSLIDTMLSYLASGNAISVRAEAARVLNTLSSESPNESTRLIIDSNGISILTYSIVAPSKEFMEGGDAQTLQENAMGALANVSGGLDTVILSFMDKIKSLPSDIHRSDAIGALASALMICDGNSAALSLVNPENIEHVLVKQLKPSVSILMQERCIEALASLYGNSHLSKGLKQSEGKRALIGLISTTSDEYREDFMSSYKYLCNNAADLWQSLQEREGIQLLISLLAVASEQEQECAVALLCILTGEEEESMWAITAGGGIPPLVQLLETGTGKVKEDSAAVLRNLCRHSEDIRSCIEKAGAIPALVWLLKYSESKGQEIACETLKYLIQNPDWGAISELVSLLDGELPRSKQWVLHTLGYFLAISTLEDILCKGPSANANTLFKSIINTITSSTKKEGTQQQQQKQQEEAAFVLAELFYTRKDLCQSPSIITYVEPLFNELNTKTEMLATPLIRCLAALFTSSIKNNYQINRAAKSTIIPLLRFAKSQSVQVAEQAISALSSILLDRKLAEDISPKTLISPITRVLRDGTANGQASAATALLQLIIFKGIDENLAEAIDQCNTVLALVGILGVDNVESNTTRKVLEVLESLVEVKLTGSANLRPPWSVLAESPPQEGIVKLVNCLAVGPIFVKEKAAVILSRLCHENPVIMGDVIARTPRCVSSLEVLVAKGSNPEVKISATSLLVCVAKEHQQSTIDALFENNSCTRLIQSLVKLWVHYTPIDFLDSNSVVYNEFDEEATAENPDRNDCVEEFQIDREENHSTNNERVVALWLLAILASCDSRSKLAIHRIGAPDAIIGEIQSILSSPKQDEGEKNENEGMWVSALVLAILFHDMDSDQLSSLSISVTSAIPVLSLLLRSGQTSNRYFAAQAFASLVSYGSKYTLLAVAESGALLGLIPLLGIADSDISRFETLVEEFSLFRNPEKVVIEHVIEIDEIRVGSEIRKLIPSLVDLLRPAPERPSASLLAVELLTKIAMDSNANKVAIAESGALEELATYLSLGPQNNNKEENVANLLGVLFTSVELQQTDSAIIIATLKQLIAVLRMGKRRARQSAAGALRSLFASAVVKNNESLKQAIRPLLEMLHTGTNEEKKAAIGALIQLSKDHSYWAFAIADTADKNNFQSLFTNVLSTEFPIELRQEAGELCSSLFKHPQVRSTPTATKCVEPLVALLKEEAENPNQLPVPIINALSNLMDNESLAELATSQGAIVYLVGMLSGHDQVLHEVSLNALAKIGRDRQHCKLQMVKYGVIEKVLQIIPLASDTLCATISQLLWILTNNSIIAKEVTVAKIVDPLISIVSRKELSIDGQHSAMQTLVNILEKPQQFAAYKLNPSQNLGPIIYLLNSKAKPIKQLAADLLSYLVVGDNIIHQEDTAFLTPVVQLVSIGSQSIKNKAIKALESASMDSPQSVAEAGGIREVSKVILQIDPLPDYFMWESAASIMRNILQSNLEYYPSKVPLQVLVRMLHSEKESTIKVSLQCLGSLGRRNEGFAEEMAKNGAAEALLELLRCRRCEEIAAKLLEFILNSQKVRYMPMVATLIYPLSEYLFDIDHEKTSDSAKLLVALSLGDLFQNQELITLPDATLACKALVNLLHTHPTEDIETISICLLENLLTRSNANRRAFAEGGGTVVVQQLLLHSKNAEMAEKLATLTKLVFSNHMNQEYASIELVIALTVGMQNHSDNPSTMEHILRAIIVLYSHNASLCESEAATTSIYEATEALKLNLEAIEDACLDLLCLVRQTWPSEVGQAQALAMAEAIPCLQKFMKSGPQRFHDRANLLLQCLPGIFKVIIKQGINFKQSIGSTNSFCKLTLGNGPPRQTKTVSHQSAPEWNEEFIWEFNSPPKGQKIHIECRRKSAFGKSSLGKMSIQVDRVITEGSITGEYALHSDKFKEKKPRALHIDFKWSNSSSLSS